MYLIPFKDINEHDEFWGGARFIKKKTGLRRVAPEQDYFEYMLINDNSSSEWMICTHIDKFEAGSVVSHIKKTTAESNRHTVTAKEFKRSNILDEELDLWYYNHVEHDRYWSQDLKSVLKKLDNISFHDLEVNSLNINFSYSFFSIDFELYNEKSENHDNWTIEFKDLIEFNSDQLPLNADSDVEITSFDYELNEFFEGKMTFILGSELPSFDLIFKCEKIKLIKN